MTNEADATKDIIAELEADDAPMADAGVNERKQLPKGKYRFRIDNVYCNKSSNSGRRQMVAVCKVVACDQGDEQIGATYYKTWGLESDDNFKWLNTDLDNLEIELPKSPKDLIRVMEDLKEIVFEATLVDNKDPNYPPNAFINAGARKETIASGGESEGPAF